MSTSLRNKFLILTSLISLAYLSCPPLYASPVTALTVTFAPLNSTFTAGQSATNTTFIITTSTGGTDIDPGTLTLELLDGSEVIPNGISPTTVAISSGQGSVFQPSLIFYRAGTSIHIRATYSNGVVGDSEDFAALRTVTAGAAAKLVLLAPGETLFQGTNPSLTDGKSGSPNSQIVGQAFDLTAILTDAQFNAIGAGANSVTISTASNVTIVSANPQNLSSGQRTFSISMDAPNVTRVITASAAGLTSGTADVTTAGPPAEEIFAFPSPFNPHTGTVKFQYRLDTASDVTVKVLDQFGQQVWENSSAGLTNTLNIVEWNGRTDMGDMAAAGAYYAILEIGGSVKSKRKFGVKK